MRDNKVLIVLGMHRSGTSLVAQWMQRCGINMGDELMGPKNDNIKGFYEDMDFFNLHKDILLDNELDESGLKGNLNQLKVNLGLQF